MRARGALCAALLLGGLASQAGEGPPPLSWQFTDVTATAGAGAIYTFEFGYINTRDMMPAGVAAGDIDNDGDIDLIVPQGDVLPLKVLRNDGAGGFQSVAASVGLNIVADIPAGALLVDIDGNGYLDLVLLGIHAHGIRLFLNEGGLFSEGTSSWGLGAATIDAYSAAAADVDGDGRLDLAVAHWDNRSNQPPTFGHLWINQGDALVDRSSEAGLTMLRDPDFSFTPILADIDGDHRPDLLMAADFGTTRAFGNNGDGSFSQWDAGQFDDENGMGADVGDYDRDGDLDWFVSSIWDPEQIPVAGQGITGNRLYRNDGGGVFTDVSAAAGVREGYWGWGSCLADFDLDGWLDIYHVNGMPFGNHPHFGNDPARLFWSRGDGTFAEQSELRGVADTGQGRGIACFDYDRDGDLDIYLTNNEGSARLYRNDSPPDRHGLGVALRQPGPNRQAVGAELRLHLDGAVQLQHLIAGRGFQASAPVEAHFGLGEADHAQALEIRWPDGRTTRIGYPQAQPLLIVDDPDRVYADGAESPAGG